MMPLCSNMIGVAKGLAGLGALFYVAYRVWQALSRAEPIDIFPLLRPFAIGLCIMFFPTIVLGTINAVLSPVVKGAHTIMENQIVNVQSLQTEKDNLEYEIRVREEQSVACQCEEWDKEMEELGIWDTPEIMSMWMERLWYDIKSMVQGSSKGFL